jgi:hypothetical protein
MITIKTYSIDHFVEARSLERALVQGRGLARPPAIFTAGQ